MAQEKTFYLDVQYNNLNHPSWMLADPTLVDPTVANALIMGEFMQLDANFKLIRGTVGDKPQYALFVEKGRSDNQASRGKVTVLAGGSYIGNTKVFTGTLALNAKVEVGSFTHTDGVTRSGLQAVTTGAVLGWVIRTAANNNDFLKFFQVLV